jgi:hypothetical protein
VAAPSSWGGFHRPLETVPERVPSRILPLPKIVPIILVEWPQPFDDTDCGK